MLIPFRSKAASEFYMMDHHVQVLFALMGKTYAAQGVIQANEVSMRLAKLQAALADECKTVQPEESPDNVDVPMIELVGLKQRAWPMLDMLSRSEKKNVDIVWGNTI
jgi:hypothetical protein